MAEEKEQEPRSYWEVFYDDLFLLFFLSVAVTYIFYTVWGLMELGNASPSPFYKP